jgi:ABC-type polysaccharide/polyol phosphate transport system ATPase subunit
VAGPIVEVHALSKRYDLRPVGTRSAIGRIGDARAHARRHLQHEERFWALREVSFTVDEGQAVGIVGRNGAGKSTLLKILARITEPTSGWTGTRGRVGTLLEVGTGFHTELTGRENIFLNGAILGMSRRRVERSLDEIVAFAGVDRFLDTPVKRYSSGMYLRLAFAVMAHLDNEILVVDEVLAVGDAEFQRKCLSRMSEVGSQGRTVLFVSHDLNAVAALCPRAIWIEKGTLAIDGPSPRVIDQYLASVTSRTGGPATWSVPGSGVILEDFGVDTSSGGPTHDRRRPLRIRVRLRVERTIDPFGASVVVYDLRKRPALGEPLPLSRRLEAGRYEGSIEVPPVLNIGHHTVSMWAGSGPTNYIQADEAAAFEVIGDDDGLGGSGDARPAVRVHPRWTIEGVGAGVGPSRQQER